MPSGNGGRSRPRCTEDRGAGADPDEADGRDAGKAIYANKLLLGGVLANETDKLFEAKVSLR